MSALILFSVLLPLLLAFGFAVPALRARLPYALPLAPLPALVLAFAGGEHTLAMPWLLEGARWGIDGLRASFLSVSCLIWIIAGALAMPRKSGRDGPRFALFWLLTLCGNLGLILALDIASFYAYFSLMTVATYPLVSHRGRRPDRRAGRVYLTLALIGEMLLLAGLMLVAAPRGLTLLIDVPQAVADSNHRHVAFALLFFGFGVKAGLPLLHFWLPAAYLAAPLPASVALGGALINAGLLGWLFTLPLGYGGWEAWGTALMLIGLTAAFGAVPLGLCQRHAKALLGYSSISQMGLVTVLLGVALMVPAVAPAAVAACGLYAMHHGLAKSALFLGVGAAPYWGKTRRGLFLALAALPGLSLAGVVATSGAAAKAGFKEVLTAAGDAVVLERLSLLLSLAAVGTTLLVIAFVRRLAHIPVRASAPVPLAAWGLGLAASLLAFWWLPRPPQLPPPAVTEPQFAGLAVGLAHPMDFLWPPLLALLLALPALALGMRAPAVPPGDLGYVLEATWQRRRRTLRQAGRALARLRRRLRIALRAGAARAGALNQRLVPEERRARVFADAGFLGLLAALLVALLLL